jgi:hypothetical protein
MTDYVAVLQWAYPGSEWSIQDNDYDTLLWYSDTSKPTKVELDALWVDTQQAVAFAEVELARHAEYTAPGGPDSVFFRWQRGDATEQEYLDSVQAVKDANPYPQA